MMRPEPDSAAYARQWTAMYEGENYGRGIAAWFLRQSHAWVESEFSASDHFGRVLEVGAGTGVHLPYLRHRFDEYVMTDASLLMLRQCSAVAPAHCADARIVCSVQDARRLCFAGASFDRLIAAHVLEHLERPYEVLREWVRVLKPGGTLSLVLPCDPGLAWRVGRAIGVRQRFVRRGLDYDYWMAREHVNPINNLVVFLRYYFPGLRESWKPFCLPSTDLNLFYIAHVRV